jgi:hypothetical protein
MAAFNKFNALVQTFANGTIDLATDTLKVMLTNTAPVATNSLYGDISANELASGAGYTTGGATITTTSSTQSGGVEKLIISAANPTWTATGSMGPFRYAVLYDTTATTPLKPLIGWWDNGSSVTLTSGQTFTVTFDATNGVLQIS